MRARTRAWTVFLLTAGPVLAALLGITAVTLQREQGEADAQAGALREERVRVALWRMDGAMAAVLSAEGARPPEEYSGWAAPSVPPPWEVGMKLKGKSAPPILLAPPFIRLSYQVDFEGRLTSSWVQEPGISIAGPDAGYWEHMGRELSLLQGLDITRGAGSGSAVPAAPQLDAGYAARQSRNVQTQQEVQDNANLRQAIAPARPATASIRSGVRISPLAASWHSPPGEGPPELLFERRVEDAEGAVFRQGFLVDWTQLKRWLLAEAKDDFPGADLVPVPEPGPGGPRFLASVPARFEPGPAVPTVLPRWSPTRRMLALLWIAALGAAAVAGFLLRAALDDAERRARFVSAVTHELRTPLTTFRMYAQMLKDGMAPPGAEGEYLATLERESGRLARVVESVLLYARLEEGKGGPRTEVMEAAALLDRVIPVLERRAAEGGLALRVGRAVGAGAPVSADPQAVEQILLNLVDNACKYAAGGGGVGLDARVEGGRLLVDVSDGGPGIPAAEREAIFEPFRRLPRDEAGSAGGAGLGLGRARAPARAPGGGLKAVRRDGPGARFRWTLPLAGSSSHRSLRSPV